MPTYTRRQLLASAATLGSAELSHAQPSTPQGLPKDVGRKMNADGSVREFLANTFIGHLAQQGEDFAVFDAFLDIYRDFPRHAFRHKIALLPPSSYHITVFGGLNEADRGTPKWISSIPADMPIERVTERYLHALHKLPKLNGMPLLFEVDMERLPPAKKEGGLTIPLRPRDLATEHSLRVIRDQLADLTGIRRKDHDSYEYHVSIGYFFQLLDSGEAQDLREATARWMYRIATVNRKPRIAAVQFCRLRDMYAYEALHQL